MAFDNVSAPQRPCNSFSFSIKQGYLLVARDDVICSRVNRGPVNDQLPHLIDIVVIDNFGEREDLRNLDWDSDLIDLEVGVWRDNLNTVN